MTEARRAACAWMWRLSAVAPLASRRRSARRGQEGPSCCSMRRHFPAARSGGTGTAPPFPPVARQVARSARSLGCEGAVGRQRGGCRSRRTDRCGLPGAGSDGRGRGHHPGDRGAGTLSPLSRVDPADGRWCRRGAGAPQGGVESSWQACRHRGYRAAALAGGRGAHAGRGRSPHGGGAGDPRSGQPFVDSLWRTPGRLLQAARYRAAVFCMYAIAGAPGSSAPIRWMARWK